VAAPRRFALTTPQGHAANALAAAVALAALGGCRDIDRFNTERPAAYCGSLVGATAFHSGFIQNGAPPSLELKLELDTSSLSDRPGTLSANDADGGFCKPSPLFADAPLRAIPEVLHDALSTADLGQGHEHDFFAWVDSTCQGTMLAVVSLLTNGAVEVRLLKPGPDVSPMADPSQRSGFALFYLQRSETGCSF
jgi:hypothetical protein